MSPQIKSVDLQYPRQVSELLCSPRRAERGPRSRTCNCPFPLTFLRLGISHGHRVTEGISQHGWGRLGPSQPAPGGLQPCFGQQALKEPYPGHWTATTRSLSSEIAIGVPQMCLFAKWGLRGSGGAGPAGLPRRPEGDSGVPVRTAGVLGVPPLLAPSPSARQRPPRADGTRTASSLGESPSPLPGQDLSAHECHNNKIVS